MASIPVLKQRSYIGKRPVIPSILADTPCSDFGIRGLLEKFNTILNTLHTLSTPWVYSILGDCILENFDIGTAYAYLRPFWCSKLAIMIDELPKCKARDQKMRQDVLDKDKIICTHVPPRRVWDLYSNRVVPWWAARQWPWGISHAWMNEEDRKDILTPINGREWPVPIPKDTSLDLIRIEMLNLGAEYVWLDVLCLRQKGGSREDLREEEWKVDVPTIGSVYDKINLNKVVCYLNGLGRPLGSNADNLESDRCWFKRAWTLQEISMNPIIGGDTGDEALRAKFKEKLSSLQDIREGRVYDVLSEMQKRVSTYLVDKIAGMAYIMGSISIPAYYGKQSEDDAWIALMDVMAYGRQSRHLADLLFLHPEPGTESWRPSWKQVMTEKLPPKLRSSDTRSNWTSQPLICDVRTDTFNHGYIIESALVRGLFDGDSQERERHGRFVVKDDAGVEHTFKIVVCHQCPIPDGLYTLLCAESWDSSVLHCVVGWGLPDQRFKKLSVFEMYDDDIVSFLSRGIATKVDTIFLD